MHVMIVRLKIKPEYVEVFEENLKHHVAMTKKNEPGCVRFDVTIDKDELHTYHIHEAYADDAAMEAHVKSATLAPLLKNLKIWSEERTRYNAAPFS